ncbi:MAG: acetate--CoA ligase family protein [Flexilinea flocculi]|nr:acetate--CoA ligase family protein [Flexilinea flocculi]
MTTSFRNLRPMLNPKSIAIIGASEKHGSAGRLVLENLHFLGYQGEIFAINPKNETVLGHPCYKDLKSVNKPIDMVAILIGAPHVKSILEQMKELQIPACWCLASGFSESGDEGKKLQKEIAAFCEENHILLCGPNCIGVANMTDKFAAFSVAINPNLRTGGVSAVMQSGAILMGLANSARFGFRYLISAGNQAVLDISDYIGYLATDPETKVILAFVEGIPNAEKFVDAVRAAFHAGKPVLMLKVGRSEGAQRAVQAHTGSLAGSDSVLDAVLQKEGVIRLNSLDELVQAAELFAVAPLPKTDGIGLLSLSGGQIGLVEDLSQGMNLNFSKLSDETLAALHEILPSFSTVSNPVDAWGNGDLEKMYPGCVAAVASQSDISLIAMSRDTPLGVADREIEQSMRIAESAVRVKNEFKKAVLLFSNFSGNFDPKVEEFLRKEAIPYLQGTQEALQAIQAFEKYAAFRRKPAPEAAKNPITSDKLAAWKKRFETTTEPLDEVEGRALLADYGIDGPHESVASTKEAAADVAEKIGFPVVLKILSPDIRHKTECGGVKIGLKNRQEVSDAFDQIMKSAHAYKPEARLEGVIVQEMISPDSVEVILGIMNDPTFGPVVVFGSGGILVELMKDSTLAIPPFTRQEAGEMINRTRGSKLLKGFRGKPAADFDALCDALVGLSFLAVDFADHIAALDINPLMVLPNGKGVRAVDVLMERTSK